MLTSREIRSSHPYLISVFVPRRQAPLKRALRRTSWPRRKRDATHHRYYLLLDGISDISLATPISRSLARRAARKRIPFPHLALQVVHIGDSISKDLIGALRCGCRVVSKP